MPAPFLTPQFIAQITLVGMGFDLLGGCYLSYDLLGGKRGPLRTMARAAGYMVLFLVGYAVVLGWKFAIVAAIGMGVLLAIELRLVGAGQEVKQRRRHVVLLFGFLRGLVLGVAGMTVAGPVFGALFGVLAGAGLTLFYALGFAPSDDYAPEVRPHISRHKVLATLSRALAVSVAGVVAGLVTMPRANSVLFGLKLGLAAGTVSALVGLFSPMIEWRIENLPERRLGVIGLGLIFLGLLLQSAQYWLVVLDISVR